jgi:hypothetical protein
MMDFDIQRCTRHCATSGRELAPGETFYSVLISEGANVVRRDYSAEAWTGPPEGVLGWWKSQMPSPDARKMHWAPHDVMLELFEELSDQPDKQDLRYVLALLLVRRRVCRLEETQHDSAGHEVMILHCPRGETDYQVIVETPSEARVAEIQEHLAKLLFAQPAK